jgi:hypothetical protein
MKVHQLISFLKANSHNADTEVSAIVQMPDEPNRGIELSLDKGVHTAADNTLRIFLKAKPDEHS